MNTTHTTTARIFLTDYASYNNGSQFEFGHWIDLTDYSDASELMEYINEHFEQADEKSPLDSPREEIMITDFENFPDSLYSESMGKDEFEKIYLLIDFMADNHLESMENEGDNLLSLWNECVQELNMSDDQIYNLDELDDIISGMNPTDILQMGMSSEINWSDDYFIFNGYGHIESVNDPSEQIDETILFEWILDNL